VAYEFVADINGCGGRVAVEFADTVGAWKHLEQYCVIGIDFAFRGEGDVGDGCKQ
jgi:hypothetical protein